MSNIRKGSKLNNKENNEGGNLALWHHLYLGGVRNIMVSRDLIEKTDNENDLS